MRGPSSRGVNLSVCYVVGCLLVFCDDAQNCPPFLICFVERWIAVQRLGWPRGREEREEGASLATRLHRIPIVLRPSCFRPYQGISGRLSLLDVAKQRFVLDPRLGENLVCPVLCCQVPQRKARIPPFSRPRASVTHRKSSQLRGPCGKSPGTYPSILQS